MRKLKFKLDRSSLEIIFTTFIRPLLEYGDIVWDNCTQFEKQEIEKIPIEAARIATGTAKIVSLNALYQETGWVTLEKRRENHKLVMFYKMYNDLTPSYLSSLVPQSINNLPNTASEMQITYNLFTLELIYIFSLFYHLW